MTQKGTHTWDLIQQYHKCPKCGFVIESREDYRYSLGTWKKDVTCGRCSHNFKITKDRKPTLGPFIGDPQPPEFDWHS